MNNDILPEGAKKIQEWLRKRDFTNTVVMLPEGAATVEAAAKALKTKPEQIAKSIVFTGVKSGRPFLAIASGINRIDEKKVEKLVGEKVKKAEAAFVKEATGFSIGGVAPMGHWQKIETLVDGDLENYKDIWAAAGHPTAVFMLNFEELLKMTCGKKAEIKAFSK